MKCFFTFALFCCFVSNTWTAPTSNDAIEEPIDPAMVTCAAMLAKKTCGPANALVAMGIGKATAAGIRRFQETNDTFLAAHEAAHYGVMAAADFVMCCAHVVIAGSYIANDIRAGKDPKDALVTRYEVFFS